VDTSDEEAVQKKFETVCVTSMNTGSETADTETSIRIEVETANSVGGVGKGWRLVVLVTYHPRRFLAGGGCGGGGERERGRGITTE